MPNSSMPVGSFRRPELRAAAEIEYQVRQIPFKYLNQIAGSSNVEKYMSLQLESDESQGTSVSQIKGMLSKHPFRFDFRNLSVKDKSNVYRVSKNFSSVDLQKFFHVSKYDLVLGMSRLILLIDAKESTKRVMKDLETEVKEILEKREKFALEIKDKYSVSEYELEQVYYIFGPTSEFELSELFFESPSSFISESYCSKCERGITNWISVILGEGPICGEHKYEVTNLGKSLKEITDLVIGLVERKYALLANGPLSNKSPLVKFRETRLDYRIGGTLIAEKEQYLAQRPFLKSSIMRDIQNTDFPSDRWREYIFKRIFIEYQPRQNAKALDGDECVRN